MKDVKSVKNVKNLNEIYIESKGKVQLQFQFQFKSLALAAILILATTLAAPAFALDPERMFAEHGSVMLLIDTQTGHIIGANPAAEKFYGYDHDELMALTISQINILSQSQIQEEMALAVSQSRNYFNFRHRLKDGTLKYVEVYSSPVRLEEDPQRPVLFSIIHDITPRVTAETAAQQGRILIFTMIAVATLVLIGALYAINRARAKAFVAKEEALHQRRLLETTLYSIGEGVISTDLDGCVDRMNAVAQQLTGWQEADARGHHISQVFDLRDATSGHPFKLELPLARIFEANAILVDNQDRLLNRRDGSDVAIENSIAPIRDVQGQMLGAVIVFRDCSDRRKRQEKIQFLSYHDQLTGLYNRHFFEEELQRLDTERNLPLSLAHIDVNGLKLTNDAFGHLQGDALLQKVASTLKAHCRADDILARIGGDEFILLLPKTPAHEAEALIQRIYGGFENLYLDTVVISISIGSATKEIASQPIQEIFIKAEDQMYHHKLSESQSMRSRTVDIIMKTLKESNPKEQLHCDNVQRISLQIGQALGLNEDQLSELSMAACMHDIGKIAVDRGLLMGAEVLGFEEMQEIRKHPEVGYHILKAVDSYAPLADYALLHHEQWDGSGYPKGLAGEAIPLLARIIAVADAYDGMTGTRPYRDTASRDEVAAEFMKWSGKQFDPTIVEIFLNQVFE